MLTWLTCSPICHPYLDMHLDSCVAASAFRSQVADHRGPHRYQPRRLKSAPQSPEIWSLKNKPSEKSRPPKRWSLKSKPSEKSKSNTHTKKTNHNLSPVHLFCLHSVLGRQQFIPGQHSSNPYKTSTVSWKISNLPLFIPNLSHLLTQLCLTL